MSGRRILFIGLNYAPEQIGIGPYTAGLAEALVARGHEVEAIVGQPYYPDWKLFSGYRRRWEKSVENGVSVTRCPHYIPANPTGSRRVAHHATFASSAYPAARRVRRRRSISASIAPNRVISTRAENTDGTMGSSSR